MSRALGLGHSTSPDLRKHYYTNVFFRALFQTGFGERVAVVGSAPNLGLFFVFTHLFPIVRNGGDAPYVSPSGNWDPKKAHELRTSNDL